jgi:hypothetical protein
MRGQARVKAARPVTKLGAAFLSSAQIGDGVSSAEWIDVGGGSSSTADPKPTSCFEEAAGMKGVRAIGEA